MSGTDCFLLIVARIWCDLCYRYFHACDPEMVSVICVRALYFCI